MCILLYCILICIYIYICTMYGITYANRGLTHSIGSLGCLLHLQTYPMIFPWYSHCCPLNLGELNPDQDSRWPLPRPRTRTFAPVFWKIALESQGQRSTLRHILCVAMWLWFETLNIKRGGKSDENGCSFHLDSHMRHIGIDHSPYWMCFVSSWRGCNPNHTSRSHWLMLQPVLWDCLGTGMV